MITRFFLAILLYIITISTINAQDIKFYIDSFSINNFKFSKRDLTQKDTNFLFKRFEPIVNQKYIVKKNKKKAKGFDLPYKVVYNNFVMSAHDRGEKKIQNMEIAKFEINFANQDSPSLNFSLLSIVINCNSTYDDIFNNAILKGIINKETSLPNPKKSLFFYLGQFAILMSFNEDERNNLTKIEIIL